MGRVHYVDEGEGPPILFLHRNAAPRVRALVMGNTWYWRQTKRGRRTRVA